MKAPRTPLLQAAALAVLAALVIAPVLLLAQTAETDAAPASRVLVLLNGRSASPSAWEERLVLELRLIFDDLQVEQRATPPGFDGLVPTLELETVRSLAAARGAVAVMWFKTVGERSGRFVLFVYGASGSKRREVAFDDDPSEAAAVALSIHEVLAEELSAVLHVSSADGAEREPSESAATVLPRTPVLAVKPTEPREPAPELRRRSQWHAALGLAVDAGTGIFGQGGVFAAFGGRLWSGAFLRRGARLDLFGAVTAVPLQDSGSLDVSGFRFEPGIEGGWAFDLGHVSLGPLLSLSVPYGRVKLEGVDGRSETFSSWNFRAALGASLMFPFSQHWYVVLDATIGVLAQRDVYRWPSTDKIELASPYVDWRAALGVARLFGR